MELIINRENDYNFNNTELVEWFVDVGTEFLVNNNSILVFIQSLFFSAVISFELETIYKLLSIYHA